MLSEKAIAAATVSIIKEYTAPLLARISDLEKQLTDMPTPRDGVDADEDAIAERVTEKLSAQIEDVRAAVEALPDAPELPDIPAMIADAVKEAMPEVPEAPGLPDIDGMVSEAVRSAVAEISIPEAPELPDIPAMISDAVKECTPEAPELPDIGEMVQDAVTEAVKTIPVPKDGAPGRDGLDVKDMFRAEGGRLMATMTDGTVKNLGCIVGKDGDPGRDGVGFDDIDVTYDGERSFAVVFQKGEVEKRFDFKLPVVLDRGVFTEGKTYERGDSVSFGGSVWIAQKDTDGKPGLSDGWRLSAKKGRNGRDAK